jgi:hypothetical protein
MARCLVKGSSESKATVDMLTQNTSALGHSRRFDRLPLTSGTRIPDSRRTSRRVRKVPKTTLASSDLWIAPVPAIQCERRCPRQDDAELGELAVFRVDVN